MHVAFSFLRYVSFYAAAKIEPTKIIYHSFINQVHKVGEHGPNEIRPNYMVRDFSLLFQKADEGKSVAAVCIFISYRVISFSWISHAKKKITRGLSLNANNVSVTVWKRRN